VRCIRPWLSRKEPAARASEGCHASDCMRIVRPTVPRRVRAASPSWYRRTTASLPVRSLPMPSTTTMAGHFPGAPFPEWRRRKERHRRWPRPRTTDTPHVAVDGQGAAVGAVERVKRQLAEVAVELPGPHVREDKQHRTEATWQRLVRRMASFPPKCAAGLASLWPWWCSTGRPWPARRRWPGCPVRAAATAHRRRRACRWAVGACTPTATGPATTPARGLPTPTRKKGSADEPRQMHVGERLEPASRAAPAASADAKVHGLPGVAASDVSCGALRRPRHRHSWRPRPSARRRVKGRT